MSRLNTLLGPALRTLGAKGFYGLEVSFSPSPDNEFHFEADPQTGLITGIKCPEVEARPQAIARVTAVLANHVRSNAEGTQACRAAAIRQAALAQHSTEEVTSLTFSLEGADLLRCMHEQNIVGVQAYLHCQEGNEITAYLRLDIIDNNTDAFRTSLEHLLVREADTLNPDSGLNPDYEEIQGFLDNHCHESDSRSRAIAANPALRALPRKLQQAVFDETWAAIEKLQVAVQTLLSRELTEDETIDLWQMGAAIPQTIADRVSKGSK